MSTKRSREVCIIAGSLAVACITIIIVASQTTGYDRSLTARAPARPPARLHYILCSVISPVAIPIWKYCASGFSIGELPLLLTPPIVLRPLPQMQLNGRLTRCSTVRA